MQIKFNIRSQGGCVPLSETCGLPLTVKHILVEYPVL